MNNVRPLVLIIDVQIAFEDVMREAADRKILKYKILANIIRDHLKKQAKDPQVMVIPIIVGARAGILNNWVRVLSNLNIVDQAQEVTKKISSSVVKDSAQMFFIWNAAQNK
jgi:hypothetical protein